STRIPISDEDKYTVGVCLYENKVYVKRNPYWEKLVDEFKLDYGYNIINGRVQIAKKKAFNISYCELAELPNRFCEIKRLKLPKNSHWIQDDKDLRFLSDESIVELIYFDGQFETLMSNKDIAKKSLAHEYENFPKASINITKGIFKISPEFKDALYNFIESKDIEKLQKIIDNFGTFIPTIVHFGGRINFEGDKLHVYGGDKISMYGGDKKTWTESLNNPAEWEPVNYLNLKSIYELLDNDLQKNLILARGKVILKAYDRDFEISDFNGHIVKSLDIPHKIVSNHLIDSQVFATLVNMHEDDNDIFAFWLYRPSSHKSHMIIHRIKPNRKRSIHLRIGWIVVGYCPDARYMIKSLNYKSHIITQKLNIQLQNDQFYHEKISKFYDLNPQILGNAYNYGFIGALETNILESPEKTLTIGHYFHQNLDNISACVFGHCFERSNYRGNTKLTINILA
ncbi:6622_t:CDS:2, partial [Acaulospora colombiana]